MKHLSNDEYMAEVELREQSRLDDMDEEEREKEETRLAEMTTEEKAEEVKQREMERLENWEATD